MRSIAFAASFRRACLIHAPDGSPQALLVRNTLATLRGADELPGPRDEADLAFPWRRFFTRAVKGTDLVLLYEIGEDIVVIHGVRLASW